MSVKYRLYCSVFGCLNTSRSTPELTFFKLPTQPKRLLEWLHLIDREDLKSKTNFTSYRVCELHFKEQAIIPLQNRKILKKNAFPSLNLPDKQKEDKQTQVVFIGIESCTQTEEETIEDLSKRKLNNELLQCDENLKPVETENITKITQKITFHKLCDKYLSKELAILVKAQTKLKPHGKGNRYNQDFILFCLNLYFTSPQAYRLLRSALCLPCTTTLNKHSFPITTEINERAMSILKIKVANMTETEKNCSVMISTLTLKPNLFYNIKEDKIVGFHEVEGWQIPQPAKNAIVIMVSGIFINWQQPIAYALLSECRNNDDITKWVDKVLKNLFDIGLNIRTYVSDLGPISCNAAKKRLVSVEKPYFFIDDRKIYYIFDTPHLIKLIRNSLMQYDFHFGKSVAKYKHVVEFFEKDVTKSCRLAPKLTERHIQPTNCDKIKVSYAIQLLSKSVATGISTYIDFNVIEKSGEATVTFITKMNELFDSLNSSKSYGQYRCAYKGNESQKVFFNEMLHFFQVLKLINPQNGHDCTSNVKFIQGFQTTINAVMFLFDDLQLEGYNILYTRRLNQDTLRKNFSQIQTKNGMSTKPTCRQFMSAFKKLYFSQIVKPPKGGNCADDLGNLFVPTVCGGSLNNSTVSEVSKISNDESDSSVQIISSEYNQLDMPDKNRLFYICGFLLKRCFEIHNDCQTLKSYVKPLQSIEKLSIDSRYSRYRDFSKNYSQNLLTVPCDDFINFIEKMEEVFRNFFKKKHIKCKIFASIYQQIKDISFYPPCPCFPDKYLKMLYLRIRIFYTLKFNNSAFRVSQKRRKCFSVTNL